ncbi:MAG: hypothetical protein LC642_04935 [Verrucomicrobiaceae bacterium]|nr:hypothetical protein [Verrucomicrobiaceae bacterium]
MTKLLALMAVAALAATSAFAGDKACCAAGATHAKNDKDCSQTYATLNLSAEQKVKMETAHAECKKGGCTKESMDTFMKSAESILSKEQFTAFKAECAKMHDKEAKA